MFIRFTRFTPLEGVHYNAGESFDFPEGVAQAHIAAKNAVGLTKAEFATMPRYGVHPPATPLPRRGKPVKGR